MDALDAPYAAAVEAIYATATQPSRWPGALAAIADCFGDVGAVLQFQRDDGSFGTIASESLAAALAEYERDGWWQRSPVVARAFELGHPVTGVDGPVTDRDLLSEEVIASHPYYTEFLASHGLKWFAGVTVSHAANMFAPLSIQRSLRKPCFSDVELALLDRFSRHVENALRLTVRLLSAEMTNRALGDALTRTRVGVFLLDAAGKVVFANAAAEALLDGGLVRSLSQISARLKGEREALERSIEMALADEPHMLDPGPVVVHSLHSPGFVALYVMPIASPTAEPVEAFLAGARVIVVAISSKGGEPPEPAVVRDVLGLTLGEARVAALVGSGISPRDAAAKLGIAEETARTALKRVFAKVGVTRQSELAALLTKLVLR